MNSISKAPISTLAKIMLILFLVVGLIHLTDFIFYGKEPRNLISAIGFSLMSYGIYKNGLAKKAPDQSGRYASIVGVVMVLSAIGMRYLA